MDVGVYQVDHVHRVSDVPEAVCLAGDQFDLVVGRLNPRVARTQADRVRDVLLAAFDLGVQFPGCRAHTVTRPPQPVFQIRLVLVGVGRFRQEPKGFLQPVRPIQFRVSRPDHVEPGALAVGQVLRGCPYVICRVRLMPGCVVSCRGLGACAGVVSVRGGVVVVVWVPPGW